MDIDPTADVSTEGATITQEEYQPGEMLELDPEVKKRQFWSAGDYEPGAANKSDYSSGLDHARCALYPSHHACAHTRHITSHHAAINNF